MSPNLGNSITPTTLYTLLDSPPKVNYSVRWSDTAQEIILLVVSTINWIRLITTLITPVTPQISPHCTKVR